MRVCLSAQGIGRFGHSFELCAQPLLSLGRYPKEKGLQVDQKLNKITCLILTEISPHSLSQLEILFPNNGTGFENFGLFTQQIFQFSRSRPPASTSKIKNLFRKNSQNVLNQFHCRTIKFLATNRLVRVES